MHVNGQAGDGKVWPRQSDLADMMGLSRGDKVAPYLNELTRIPEGQTESLAVTKTYSSTMPAHMVYEIHDDPPSWYDGPRSLAEWYRQHPRETRVRARRTKASPPSGPDGPDAQGVSAVDDGTIDPSDGACPEQDAGAKPQVTPVTPISGQQDEAPPVTPDSGLLVTPISGYQLVRRELDEVNNQPTCRDGSTPGPVVAEPQQQVGWIDSKTPESDEEERVESARVLLRQATAGVPAERMPGTHLAGEVLSAVADALRRGYSTTVVAAHLGAPGLEVATVPGRMLLWRVKNLPPMPEPHQAASPTKRPVRPGGWLAELAGRPSRERSRTCDSAKLARQVAAQAASRRAGS